jgi:PAS domain S-box-containing protein
MRESLRADFAEAVLAATSAELLFDRALRTLATGLRAEVGCLVELEPLPDRARPRFHAVLGFQIESARSAGDWVAPTQAVAFEQESAVFEGLEASPRNALVPDALREKGCVAALALPLNGAWGFSGAIWLGFAEPFALSDEGRRFADSVAGTLLSGLARLQRDRGTRRFRQCVDLLRDGILVMRSDGRLLDANDTAVGYYGYTREELFERSILDLRAGSTLPEVLWQMRRAGMTGLVFETTHRRKDGCLFRCEVRSGGAMVDGEHVLISLIRQLDEP